MAFSPKRSNTSVSFHQGFQTPRNEWKHEAEGAALLLFRVRKFSRVISEE